MKKKLSLICFLFIFFINLVLVLPAQAQSFDFQLVPKITKSASSEGYYSKISLSPLLVQKGKLNYYKSQDWDYISFEGEYDDKSGELKGIFTGTAASSTPNAGYFYYCEFSAQIKKDQKETTLKYYPIHNSPETLNHCYAQVIFDLEKNRRAPRDEWWPDDLVFEIRPLDSGNLEDSGVRFSDISGLVEILLPTGYDADGEPIFEDEEGWNYAKLDMQLPYGAKVRLGDKSRIILSMPDMTTYEMRTPEYSDDPPVEIILPRKNKGDNVLKLMAGQLWSNVKKMVKDGSMDIEMGQAVAGIKGTIFVLKETSTESRISVLEGEVEFRSKVNNDVVVVFAGEKIAASSFGLQAKEKFDHLAEIKKWDLKYSQIEKDFLENSKSEYEQRQNINAIYTVIFFLCIAIIVFLFFLVIKQKR